jgi:S-adenosylmethionine:tRNA ribosyltransferase-isomerase
MKKSEFYFELPQELIAQHPLPTRSDSRLLAYDRKNKAYGHHQFRDLVDFLQAGDLLVMNDSQVIPARLFGKKVSGGKVELLLERILDQHQFLAQIKSNKSLAIGTQILLAEEAALTIIDRASDLFLCKSSQTVLSLLDRFGHVPLPSYIERAASALDLHRYQTIYAKIPGSVAVPSAGLHFDETLLLRLMEKGVACAYVTLHVGAGTFQPIRQENIQDHRMHAEHFTITPEVCDMVNACKARRGRVIAVGTTALRTLESAAHNGVLSPMQAETRLFVYPGYQFQICDGLVTNFHLPESSLLVLVAAFIGHQETMALYEEAIQKRYRFFSYGDSTLLL